MSTKPTIVPPKPDDKSQKDWEKEFFDKHGITDESEKNAIRGRSRVLAYDRARQKAEAEESESNNPPKPKKWFDE